MIRANCFYIMLMLTLGAVAPAIADEPGNTNPVDAVEPADDSTGRPDAGGLRLETTSIRGNQELPRVMVIVPWKDPAMGDVVGKPVNSLIDEVLKPVDRDVFRRQTKYFDQLYADPELGP
jgi:hypothetical protein